jgi:hypothetical protein
MRRWRRNEKKAKNRGERRKLQIYRLLWTVAYTRNQWKIYLRVRCSPLVSIKVSSSTSQYVTIIIDSKKKQASEARDAEKRDNLSMSQNRMNSMNSDVGDDSAEFMAVNCPHPLIPSPSHSTFAK